MEERTVTISRQVAAEYVKKENGKYTCIPVEKEVETESAKRILKVPSIIIEELEKRKIRNEGEKVLFGNDYKDNDLVSCQKQWRIQKFVIYECRIEKNLQKSWHLYCDDAGFKGYVCGKDVKVRAGFVFHADSTYGIWICRRDL